MSIHMNLRTIPSLTVLAAVLLTGAASAAAAEPIFGNWLTDDRSGIVKIGPCGQKLCGKIIRVLDPKAPANDINNPDPQGQLKPLIGTAVLRNFIRSGSEWKDGRAYDPKAGKSYHSKLKLMNNGMLKVTGCILFLCRSRYWTRSN